MLSRGQFIAEKNTSRSNFDSTVEFILILYFNLINFL